MCIRDRLYATFLILSNKIKFNIVSSKIINVPPVSYTHLDVYKRQILDSFAGSGTTAHAVLKQNSEDGGNRKFLLVEMDENVSHNITFPRVKRITEGYIKANGESVPGLGGGFQFCKLSAESVFTAEGQIRPDVTLSLIHI